MPSIRLEEMLQEQPVDAFIRFKYRIQRRHDSRTIQPIPVNRSTRGSCGNSRVVYKIVGLDNEVITDIIIIGNVMVKIIKLTYNPMFGGIGKRLAERANGVLLRSL